MRRLFCFEIYDGASGWVGECVVLQGLVVKGSAAAELMGVSDRRLGRHIPLLLEQADIELSIGTGANAMG